MSAPVIAENVENAPSATVAKHESHSVSAELTTAPLLHRKIIEPTFGWQPVNLRELRGYRDLLLLLAMRDLKVRDKQTALRTHLDHSPAHHYDGTVHVDFRPLGEHQFRFAGLPRLLFLGGPILGVILRTIGFGTTARCVECRIDSESLLSSAHFGAITNSLKFCRFLCRLFAVGNSDA